MNVIDYAEASLRLSIPLLIKLSEADAKYIRFTLSNASELGYCIIEPDDINQDDYVIRLDSSTSLVLSSQVYAKILGKYISVTEGLKGTELILT